MSSWKWMTGMVAVVLASLTVQAGEDFYCVKVKGLDKKLEMKVISAADFKALEAAIKLEQKYFPEAVAQAAKEWRADELNKKTPFAGNKLTPRAIMMSSKFSSQEKAAAEQEKYEAQLAKKAEREVGKAAKKKGGKEKADPDAGLSGVATIVQQKLDALIAKGGSNAKPAEGGVDAMVGGKANPPAKKDGK